MDYQFVKTPGDLDRYLDSIRSAEWIGIDTEFISEGKYRTELCLIQAATSTGMALIDAPALGSAVEAFWTRLCDPTTLVSVHSCRSEMEFCFQSIRRLPPRVFDIQLAAGFVGLDYPMSLKRLAEGILKIDVPKDETRSDWRARPLSLLQIEYALNDVFYLHEMTQKLQDRLEKLGRSEWFQSEMTDHLRRMRASFSDSQWERISGISTLGRRELAIVRELWRWREEKASKGRKRPNHILRDDLIVELARRKSSDPDRIASLRGLHKRSDLSLFTTELPAVIERGLSIPEEELPEISVLYSYPNYAVASSFLLAILHNEAKRKGISPNILATPQDLRELVARHAGTLPDSIQPRLTSGWRREFLGTIPEEILSGHAVIRLTDPTGEVPMEILPYSG